MTADTTVTDWLADHPVAAEPAALLRAAADLDEAVRWRRLTFTVDDNWHHWLCGITSEGVLVFHRGALLTDPTGLLTGASRYARQLPPTVALEAPDEVQALVLEAITHQTDAG